jgi:hypothetical protein
MCRKNELMFLFYSSILKPSPILKMNGIHVIKKMDVSTFKKILCIVVLNMKKNF